MSIHKDKIIEDLQRENQTLRTSPTRETCAHDLRASELSLKTVIESRVSD